MISHRQTDAARHLVHLFIQTFVEDQSSAAFWTFNSVRFLFFFKGFVCLSDLRGFFPALCFILQLHINYAGEHQS